MTVGLDSSAAASKISQKF